MTAPSTAIPAASRAPRRTVSRSVTLSSASVRSCFVTSSLMTNCLPASACASACSHATPRSRRYRANERVECKYHRLPDQLTRVGTIVKMISDPVNDPLDEQCAHNSSCNLLRRRIDRHRDRVLIGRRLLQRIELALEQSRRHEVALARREARGDQIELAFEVDKPHIRALLGRDEVAVDALERRAGDNAGRARRAVLGDK